MTAGKVIAVPFRGMEQILTGTMCVYVDFNFYCMRNIAFSFLLEELLVSRRATPTNRDSGVLPFRGAFQNFRRASTFFLWGSPPGHRINQILLIFLFNSSHHIHTIILAEGLINPSEILPLKPANAC